LSLISETNATAASPVACRALRGNELPFFFYSQEFTFTLSFLEEEDYTNTKEMTILKDN